MLSIDAWDQNKEMRIFISIFTLWHFFSFEDIMSYYFYNVRLYSFKINNKNVRFSFLFYSYLKVNKKKSKKNNYKFVLGCI